MIRYIYRLYCHIDSHFPAISASQLNRAGLLEVNLSSENAKFTIYGELIYTVNIILIYDGVFETMLHILF